MKNNMNNTTAMLGGLTAVVSFVLAVAAFASGYWAIGLFLLFVSFACYPAMNKWAEVSRDNAPPRTANYNEYGDKD